MAAPTAVRMAAPTAALKVAVSVVRMVALSVVLTAASMAEWLADQKAGMMVEPTDETMVDQKADAKVA